MLPAKKYEHFDPVLTAIAEGKMISDACEEHGLEPSAFYRARKADPDLEAKFAAAQELGLERLADTLANVHEEIANPLMARVVSENRRWLLARRLAKRYGDKIAITDDRRQDLTDILREAIARIPRPTRDPDEGSGDQVITINDIFGS